MALPVRSASFSRMWLEEGFDKFLNSSYGSGRPPLTYDRVPTCRCKGRRPVECTGEIGCRARNHSTRRFGGSAICREKGFDKLENSSYFRKDARPCGFSGVAVAWNQHPLQVVAHTGHLSFCASVFQPNCADFGIGISTGIAMAQGLE